MIQTYRIIKNKTLDIKIIFKNIKSIFATFGFHKIWEKYKGKKNIKEK